MHLLECSEFRISLETIPRERRARRSSERAGGVQEDNHNSAVNDKYLEVAILADESVVEAHGNHSEEYLLVLASIVSLKVPRILLIMAFHLSFPTSKSQQKFRHHTAKATFG